jgi:nucleoside-diphosphate-sugar epimerase
MEAMVKNPSLGGKAYFIGQSEPVELWKWLNQIFIKLNLPEISKKISFQNAFLLGGMMEKFWKFLYFKGEPPMTRFVASQLAHDHWFSNDMANQDLGYEPITSMNESLDNCIDWLRNL